MSATYPAWAETMRELYRADTVSQFLLHGNIHDLVVHDDGKEKRPYELRSYLTEVLFAPFELVLCYDRSRGIQVLKGQEGFAAFLQVMDKWHGTRFASDLGSAMLPEQSLANSALLPKAPLPALELIDRLLQGVATNNRKTLGQGRVTAVPGSVAVLLDYASFLVPRADALQSSGETGALLIKILRWAQDPALQGAGVLTCLLTENQGDLATALVESEHVGRIALSLPSQADMEEYVGLVLAAEPRAAELCAIPLPVLGQKLMGISRVHAKNILLRALRNDTAVTPEYLRRLRKETIEKEAAGRLVFLESPLNLDSVSGHTEAKQWLRDDAKLLARGANSALPMGYLITGRIGTGKTFLVQCFAGECGVPFVELVNFRDKWVGSTEGNLEKVFQILHALGQVVVFVDEADQATGKRDSGSSDGGLSGRIYAMLAKEMSQTANRGKILWIFATSRPDLVEVDLKRQGRLDVHIPLFPPVDKAERQALFASMARKLKLPLTEAELPELPFEGAIGGNELEGLLVRAARRYELQPPAAVSNAEAGPARKSLPEVVAEVVAQFRPSAHTDRLELMDLLAVRECTDSCFLPERFRDLAAEALEQRIARLSVRG